jgi:archaellum component FlaC
MIELSNNLKDAINSDIEDVKKANHEKLLERNDLKLALMTKINDAQNELNQLVALEIQKGTDINIFRDDINNLEENLKELYELNGKLASIVLPVKEMYKKIIDEITLANGGALVEVKA